MDDVKSAAACYVARNLHTIEWSFLILYHRSSRLQGVPSAQSTLAYSHHDWPCGDVLDFFSLVILASIPSNFRDPFITNNNNSSTDLISYEVLTVSILSNPFVG